MLNRIAIRALTLGLITAFSVAHAGTVAVVTSFPKELTAAYKKAFDSAEFKEFAAKASLNLSYQDAAAFTKFLDQNYSDVASVMKKLGLAK